MHSAYLVISPDLLTRLFHNASIVLQEVALYILYRYAFQNTLFSLFKVNDFSQQHFIKVGCIESQWLQMIQYNNTQECFLYMFYYMYLHQYYVAGL